MGKCSRSFLCHGFLYVTGKILDPFNWSLGFSFLIFFALCAFFLYGWDRRRHVLQESQSNRYFELFFGFSSIHAFFLGNHHSYLRMPVPLCANAESLQTTSCRCEQGIPTHPTPNPTTHFPPCNSTLTSPSPSLCFTIPMLPSNVYPLSIPTTAEQPPPSLPTPVILPLPVREETPSNVLVHCTRGTARLSSPPPIQPCCPVQSCLAVPCLALPCALFITTMHKREAHCACGAFAAPKRRETEVRGDE